MRAARTLLLLSLGLPTGMQAQALPLPIGARGQGSVAENTPSRFQFTPSAAGLLTISISSSIDLGIRVVDPDGQALPSGVGDIDFSGKPGLEFLAVPLGTVEPVTVVIESVSGDAGAFTIASSFIAEPAFAMAPDPDRRPSLAQSLQVAQPHQDTLDPNAGDRWDWYVITAPADGSLVVVTRADGEGEPGDLSLELYVGNDFENPSVVSDDDLQDVATNESVTAIVKKGDKVYVKVNSLFESAEPFGYRITVGQLP